MTIDNCVFENNATPIYTPDSSTPPLTIKNSTFTGSEYAAILYGDNSEFLYNEVNSAKLNIVGENCTVKWNTFNGESRVKYYIVAVTKENYFNDTSYIIAATDEVGEKLDLTGNYFDNADTALGYQGNKLSDDVIKSAKDGQLVETPAKPDGPADPAAPNKPADKVSDGTTETGDDANILLPMGLALAALLGMGALVATRRRNG